MKRSSPTLGIATSGHSAMSGTSGNRSGVAKAVRGSMIVMSKPASRAIGARAWLICTAPITTIRGGGTLTVMNTLSPAAVVTDPEAPERRHAAISSRSGSLS